KMTIGIGFAGTLIGWGMGWWLGHQMTALYTEYFRFPWLDYTPGAAPMVISGAAAMGAVVLGALRAVLAAVRLAPAVAMAPPAPPVYRRGWADALGHALGLRQTTMMIVRSLTRWPGRAAVTLFGVAGSVAVLIVSFVTFDIIDLVMEDIFDRTNRQHATVILHQPVKERAELDALSLPGVLHAEGVHVAPVRIRHGQASKLVSLTAQDPGADLTRLLDPDGTRIPLPDSGVALPESLADHLGLVPGETVQIELLAPPRQPWDVTVTSVFRQSMGQDILMRRDVFFALMNETPQVNMLHLAIDPAALPALQAQVKQTPAITGFTLWEDVRSSMEETMNESLITMTIIFSVLGMLITIGVVYNATRIQLAERAHELASLRVLGFRRAEVGYVLIAEQMLLTLIAVPVGWLLGYWFAVLMTQGFSTDIISLPMVISQATYAQAALTALATAFVSVLMVRRRLDRIDIVTALKQKE
ncbi:MAG TPA: ABC transporter permease, partial [Paracoccaceae bacterium]|nr:ABC transporter permease [Paracoccaceae bacterium]